VASVAPDSSLPSAGASFATHRLMPQAEGRLAAVRGTLVDARCSGIAPAVSRIQDMALVDRLLLGMKGSISEFREKTATAERRRDWLWRA
jgi:hypothetical protein